MDTRQDLIPDILCCAACVCGVPDQLSSDQIDNLKEDIAALSEFLAAKPWVESYEHGEDLHQIRQDLASARQRDGQFSYLTDPTLEYLEEMVGLFASMQDVASGQGKLRQCADRIADPYSRRLAVSQIRSIVWGINQEWPPSRENEWRLLTEIWSIDPGENDLWIERYRDPVMEPADQATARKWWEDE